jgi:hypothetical protein
VHLPIIRHCRHLFRKIAMLHKATCVGVAFNAMIFDKLYGFFGGFAEFVLRVGRDSDDCALRGQAGNRVRHDLAIAAVPSHSYSFLPKRPSTTCFAISLMMWPARLSPLTREAMKPLACLSVRCGGKGTTSGSVLTSITTGRSLARASCQAEADTIGRVYVDALKPSISPNLGAGRVRIAHPSSIVDTNPSLKFDVLKD